jgi:hypothetical protein
MSAMTVPWTCRDSKPPSATSITRMITSVPTRHSATGLPLPSSPPWAICGAGTERVHALD